MKNFKLETAIIAVGWIVLGGIEKFFLKTLGYFRPCLRIKGKTSEVVPDTKQGRKQ
jgi:hypothetical protein